jgi:serine/threonine kinase 38
MKNVITIQDLIKQGKITNKTLERVAIAKSYIEKKYSIKKIKEEIKKKDWDLITSKLNNLNLSESQKEELKKNFLHQEAEQLRQQRKKMTIYEFVPLTIIGRGAFGEVRVCRQKSTGDIVAIKKMRKEDMISKNQLMHVRTEKEILTADNPWIVKLKYSFQDDYFLYLVMDFLPGGDLMNLLMKKDILTEDEARFYTAEMILAVDSVHKLNCIHRDLKPDNILIDKKGHIQLSDFGLSKIAEKNFFPMTETNIDQNNLKANNKDDPITLANKKNSNKNISTSTTNSLKNKKRTRLMAYSTVGTPDYIAPEVFGQNGYGQEVDWWSIGVMFFEMVVGYPPFFSENPSDTCKKILKWKQYFSIPNDANLSPEAKSLIKSMVTTPENRLGYNGVEEIKKHPFFKGIDWDNIRNVKAPFIPDIKNDYDTKYFDTFPEQESFYPPESKKRKRKDINYAGYTFNRDIENMKDGFIQALEVLEVVKKTTENKETKEIIDDKDTNKNLEENNDDEDIINNDENVEEEIEDNNENHNKNDKKSNNENLNEKNHKVTEETKNKKENLKLEKKNDNSLQNSLLNHKLLNTNTTTNNNNHIVLNQKHTIQNTHQLVNKINLGNSYNVKKLSKSPETKQNNNNSNKKENKIESKISNISLKTNRDRISSGKGKSPLLAKLKLNIDNNLLKEKGLKKNKAEFCKTENNFNNKEIKKKK